MNRIEVMSRIEAESLDGKPDWLVISIREPGQDLPRLQPGWGAVLSLSFHDKEDVQLANRTGLWRMFSAEDAQACWEFVKSHALAASGLIVHCGAGLSRSPAIARAIAKNLKLPIGDNWTSGNQHVYQEMCAMEPQDCLQV